MTIHNKIKGRKRHNHNANDKGYIILCGIIGQIPRNVKTIMYTFRELFVKQRRRHLRSY